MNRQNPPSKKPGLLSIIIPGFLVAATGVGAGDLATASLTGSQLGVAVLWAVVVGGFLKFILTEGLARWQLVTGETFLEGVAHRLGHFIGWFFPALSVVVVLFCRVSPDERLRRYPSCHDNRCSMMRSTERLFLVFYPA